MGCNCKAQNDFKKIVNKYGETTVTSSNKSAIGSLVSNMLRIICNILVGILSCVLFIVMAIPVMIYVIICILFGMEPTVRMPWIGKQNKLRNKIASGDGGK